MGVLAEVQIDLLPFEHARVHRVKDGKTKWERVFSTRNMGVSVLVKSQYKHLLTASLPTSEHESNTLSAEVIVNGSRVGVLIGVIATIELGRGTYLRAEESKITTPRRK